jgi:hypothetical protein
VGTLPTVERSADPTDDFLLAMSEVARRVAYRSLGTENPAPITSAYEEQADPVIETQLEKDRHCS